MGEGAVDGGLGAVDAGEGAVDVGVGAVDAGEGAVDVGVGAVDAGVGAVDGSSGVVGGLLVTYLLHGLLPTHMVGLTQLVGGAVPGVPKNSRSRGVVHHSRRTSRQDAFSA